MSKFDIDIIIPSIRILNWPVILESISLSCRKYNWRVFFIGPFDDNVVNQYFSQDIKCIQDWGSPNRCQHLGILESNAKFVTWCSDDKIYPASSIDDCVDKLDKFDFVVPNYLDKEAKFCLISYINCRYPKCHKIADSWVSMDIAFSSLENVKLLGGFDCRFETAKFGRLDLAIRAQSYGFSVHTNHMIVPGFTLKVDNMTRLVMHSAAQKDLIKYEEKYNKDFEEILSSDNFEQSEQIWSKRFNPGDFNEGLSNWL